MAAAAGTADRARARVCTGEEGERGEAWLGGGSFTSTQGRGGPEGGEPVIDTASAALAPCQGTVATGEQENSRNPPGTISLITEGSSSNFGDLK